MISASNLNPVSIWDKKRWKMITLQSEHLVAYILQDTGRIEDSLFFFWNIPALVILWVSLCYVIRRMSEREPVPASFSFLLKELLLRPTHFEPKLSLIYPSQYTQLTYMATSETGLYVKVRSSTRNQGLGQFCVCLWLGWFSVPHLRLGWFNACKTELAFWYTKFRNIVFIHIAAASFFSFVTRLWWL